jgi:hypothetical protein
MPVPAAPHRSVAMVSSDASLKTLRDAARINAPLAHELAAIMMTTHIKSSSTPPTQELLQKD